MKKKTIAMMMATAVATSATLPTWADDGTTITIGNGESKSSLLPVDSMYGYSLSQQIYTSEEIGATGTVVSIAFKNGGGEKTRTLDVYLVHTTKSSFSGGSDWISVTEADKAFSGDVTFAAGDWTTIPLDTSFAYNGTDNLVVVVDDNTGSFTSGVTGYAFEADGMALYAHSDDTNYNPASPGGAAGTLMGKKNQLQLRIVSSNPDEPPDPDEPDEGGIVDLSTLSGAYTARDGDTLTGMLGENVTLTIADGATVTISNAVINGVNDENCPWAGITCEGNATIVLEGENAVKGFYEEFPGIFVPEGRTLTIEGDGSLDVSSNGRAAGIGGASNGNCGDIVIAGGDISATGGTLSAGIGSAYRGTCGNITVGADVVRVSATSGDGCDNAIGAGVEGSCGAITVDSSLSDETEGNTRVIEPLKSVTADVTLRVGTYFKATLPALGYDVPTNGTPYSVVAKGLPAGLKLKFNAAVTKKDKKGKKVVVKKAKVEWWIEGVPTAALDYVTNPPYLVITVDGVAQTLPLSMEVLAQDVAELDNLALGQTLKEQFYLPGVTNGWTVSGLPSGLKYTAKPLTTKKKVTVKGKKKTVVTTNTLPYSVYGKTTKAGLFTVTAKKKKGAYYETMKYRVLVTPKAVDAARFGNDLSDIETMAYVPVEWDLVNGLYSGSRLPGVSAVGGKVAKVSGLPKGLSFAAADVYSDKKKTKLKQAGQTIVGTPTKPGTYVVTFTKNVKSGSKTVAKTAQILWKITPSDAEPSLDFNTAGGVIECGSVGLKYGDLLAFDATDGAKVTASGLPSGIALASLGDGKYAFTGFTAKAGTYLVTVTATQKGKTVSQRLALKVEALPAWAKGTFNGYATGADGATNGLATVTVSSAGKISGKFQELGTNWTFSAASYTAQQAGSQLAADAFTCSNVVAKYTYKVKSGKTTSPKTITRTFALTVSATSTTFPAQGGMAAMTESGMADASSASSLTAYQNVWGRASYKTLGKKLFYTDKKHQYKTFTVKDSSADGLAMGLPEGATLSLKVTAKGAVTATMTFDTGKTKKDAKTKKTVKVYYKPSCQTVVIPTSAADADPFTGEAFLFFAPSPANNFPGYAGVAPF